MRPFRAVAVVAVGIAFWAGLRASEISDEVARRFDPVVLASDTAEPRAPGRVETTPAYPPDALPVPPARPPEVMVYSYPAPGSGEAGPRPLYRLAARRATQAGARSDAGEAEEAAAPPSRTKRRREPAPGTHVVEPSKSAAQQTMPDLHAAAHEAATRAYAYERAGDRRAAVGAFAVARSLAPDHPNAAAWAKAQRRLSKWWRVEVYFFHRGADGTLIRQPNLPAATPVLGGSANSAMVALSPNPLSRRPVEVQARYTMPYDGFKRSDASRAQVAVGIAARPFPRVPLTIVAERLFKLGSLGRNDWQLRGYGGTSRRVRGIDVSAFAEAGVVGRRPDSFAGAQLIAEKPVHLPAGIELGLGLGAWGAVQHTDRTITRLDFGPTLRFEHARLPVSLRVDYRVKATGNARPGSGLAVTVSKNF